MTLEIELYWSGSKLSVRDELFQTGRAMKHPFRAVEILIGKSTNRFDPSHHLFKFQHDIQPGFPTLVPANISFVTWRYVPSRGC